MIRFSCVILLGIAFVACSKKTYLADVDPHFYRIHAEAAEQDPDIESMIAPYKEKLDVAMGEIIGYSAKNMSKEKPESLLGNFLGDLLLAQALEISNDTVHFAVQNYGGIRIAEIAEGPVTRRKIFELMPFDNMLEILKMDSATVHRFIDHMAGGYGWPVSYTLRYKIEEKRAVQIEINGEPLRGSMTYRVAMPDYIANGGDGSYFLKELPRESTGVFIRDLIIGYIMDNYRRGGTIGAELDGRIKIVNGE